MAKCVCWVKNVVEHGPLFQGNKGQNLRGTGNKDIYIGSRHDKIGIRFFMWEFNTPLYFRGTGTLIPGRVFSWKHPTEIYASSE